MFRIIFVSAIIKVMIRSEHRQNESKFQDQPILDHVSECHDYSSR